MTAPDVSVILCTRDPRRDLLDWTLASLASQDLAAERFELIVVDNDSRPPLRHPARDIAGSATQLDCQHPGHVSGQEFELSLREVPATPIGVFSSPTALASRDPVVRHTIPIPAVLAHVLGEFGIRHVRRTSTLRTRLHKGPR